MLVSRPAVPEESDGDEEGKEDAGRKAHFGLEDAVVSARHADDRCVAEARHEGQAEEETKADSHIGQSTDLGRPAVRALENTGDGCEEQVKKPVHDGHVKGKGEDDGGEEDHT